MEEIPEPQPEMLDPPFDIKQFSCQRTKCHGKNKKHGPTGSYVAVFDCQHVGERAGNTDKQNGNATSFHENILYIFPQALFEKKAQKSSGDDSQGVDDRSKSKHRSPPLYVKRTIPDMEAERFGVISYATENILTNPLKKVNTFGGR